MSRFTRGLRLRPSVALRTRRATGAATAPLVASLTPDDCQILRDMARYSGWAERGGQLMRAHDRTANKWERTYWAGQTGEVTGRSSWVGQPQWARGLGMNPEQITNVVEKALAGKRLGKAQRAVWETMLIALVDYKEP